MKQPGGPRVQIDKLYIALYSLLPKSLWRASGRFRAKIIPLLAGESVKLRIAEYADYSRRVTPFYSVA